MFPPLLLLQHPIHAREVKDCDAVFDLFIEAVPPPPGEAIDIVTLPIGTTSIPLLIVESAHASNSIPSPESVEFGED